MLDLSAMAPLTSGIAKLTGTRETLSDAHNLLAAALGLCEHDMVKPCDPASVAKAITLVRSKVDSAAATLGEIAGAPGGDVAALLRAAEICEARGATEYPRALRNIAEEMHVKRAVASALKGGA